MGALDVRVGVREVRTGTSAMEYDWDAENVRHIARHDVEPYEAEEAVEDPRRALRRRGVGEPAPSV